VREPFFQNDVEFTVGCGFELNDAFDVDDSRPVDANEALRIKSLHKVGERGAVEKLLADRDEKATKRIA